MHRTRLKIMFALASIVVIAMAGVAFAGGGPSNFKTDLTGFREDPLALSTTGNGEFQAKINNRGDAIDWSLTFGDLEGSAQQAHIHIGQPSQSGGIAVFFCTNLGNGPAGTPACPASGTLTGTVHAGDVVGPTGQGITAGQLAEVINAIRTGAAYVNVHSSLYPTGEIRGNH
jgi:hypothetical protein